MTYSVATENIEYQEYKEQWTFINDFYKGELRVKKKGTLYLPNPFSSADEKVSDSEYDAFLNRTPFLAITTRTANAMVGLINRKSVVAELPEKLKYLIDSFNGEGLLLDQHINRTVGEVVRLGRYGLMGELPSSGGQSKADNMNGSMPYCIGYKAEDIINWSVINKQLTLVVLREEVPKEEGQTIFGFDNDYQYRVLMINDKGNYEQRLYSSENVGAESYELIPVAVKKKPLKSIPFCFIGSQNNDEQVDEPPMLPVTSANKTVYQYAGDARNIAHQTSFISTFISGFSDSNHRKEFRESGICLGTKQINLIPDDSQVTVAQGMATTGAGEGEKQAIEQAVRLGAELITEQTNQTATAAGIQAASSTSQLAQIAQNVEDGYKWFIDWTAEILGASDEYILEVNKEFGVFELSVEERAQMLQEVINGFLPISTFYNAMRKAGKIDKDVTDEELQSESVDSISNADQI